ncbi:MAG: SpoIIE family protein phosphatase [Candidatus Poribacteria bacterium]
MEISNNPYLNRTMIRDINDFYGREKEVARIYSRIRTAHPQSVSIVGIRRIGKSSLLNYIYQTENREKYLKEPDQYKFLFIDFQERKKITLKAFFGELYDMFSTEFSGNIQLSKEPNYEGLKNAISQVQQKELKLIFLFDEFDSITCNTNFDMEFFAFLRALANRYDVAYIVSSGRRLQELCHTREITDSPFFNIFSNLFLLPFTHEEALDLIITPSKSAGLSLDPFVDDVISMSGYFPFFIQIACSAFFEYIQENDGNYKSVSLPDIHKIFLDEATDHFDYMWEHCPEDQKKVLIQIAEGKIPHESQQYIVKELQKHGYIIDKDDRQILFSELFREYILELASFESPLEIPMNIERMERIEQELNDAREMQQSILPSENPIFGDLDISNYFRPATEVGGDYYDFIKLSDSKIAVAIGDVKGHGMSAGLLVSTASGCLHTTLETTNSIVDIMRVMNRRIHEIKNHVYMTFCFSIVDIDNKTLTFCNAGHPFPYHYRLSTQELVPWGLLGDLPLGVTQDYEYAIYSRSLDEGDIIVYFSDGLVEGTNDQEQFYGFSRLEDAIIRNAHLTAYEMREAILTDFFEHCRLNEQEDDITLVVIKFERKT